MIAEAFRAKLDALPTAPGVYIMRNAERRVIYVGKAVNLRSRVRSYFQESAQASSKIRRLVSEVADLEFIVTATELEALVLECNLIKEHRPRFNVRLKDDKRYPYIKIHWQDPFPRVEVTREMRQDGARYYGPFADVGAVRQTLDLLRRIFPYLTCTREITGKDSRACLYYHIKRCSGPCIGAISQEDYRATIHQICLFLEGKTERVQEQLRAQMKAAAERLDYERAAFIRDQIAAVQRVVERQRVVTRARADEDIIAFARADGDTCVQVFFIRDGKLIGRESFLLDGVEDDHPSHILGSFVKQFYDEAAYVPPQIVLPDELDERLVVESWLRQKRGHRVAVRVPRRGEQKALVEMASRNAAETLAHLRAQWQADEAKWAAALAELQQALGLPEPPTRMECYDISNIQGASATGSMVVFVKGIPRKSDYRRFRIKTVEGADDFAMMTEVLRRRLLRLKSAESKEPRLPGARPDSFALKPDLIVVDGGKGQLNAARRVMEELGVGDIALAALAKEREEVFVPDRPDPLPLPADSQASFLLQRLRDEAHRFAVAYHRTIRQRTGLASSLDQIPGIGPRRRKALLTRFGSLDGIRRASVEELAAVPGMTRELAERVKDLL
ncbi:MAG: excinuclease ABC subunit UvrC [Chloroflexi bacterium]|nr:excinuclease ABC subunit UvrC [Chloroflexota bacterium]